MTVMRVVGDGHLPPAHARVREAPGEYVIALELADFTAAELTIESIGRRLTVCGEHRETKDDDGAAFRLQERLEESFRLPDDADAEQITVFLEHGTLEIHVPRTRIESRRLSISRRHPTDRFNPNAEPC